MKAEFDIRRHRCRRHDQDSSQIATENRPNVGFSDGDIRGIDTANVYNNRQAEAPRQVTGPMVRWRGIQAAPPVVDATEALASRIEPQGARG